MGFNFNFFGTSEHRVFNYKPRYYDPEREELKKKFGAVDGSEKKQEYVPGSYIKGSLRDGNYRQTRETSRNQKILGIISLLLFFSVLFLIAKFYSLI